MKFLIVAFLALAVGASAFPQEYEMENRAEQRNAVERQIERFFEEVSEAIRANGLDPLQINRMRVETSPQPGIDFDLLIQELNLVGASEIQIHRLIWNHVGSRLRLEVVLPSIRFSLGKSSLSINFHGKKYSAHGDGDFELTRLTFSVDMRMNIGIISGISITSVQASLTFGNVRSDINLKINGEDYGPALDLLINLRIPRWVEENQDTINVVVSEIIKRGGNYILASR